MHRYPISVSRSSQTAALRYWKRARQRYQRRFGRSRPALRVSADGPSTQPRIPRAETRVFSTCNDWSARDTDSPLEEAVSSEPVSENRKFQSWRRPSEFPIESTSRIRHLQSKFPTKSNREIIVPEQG